MGSQDRDPLNLLDSKVMTPAKYPRLSKKTLDDEDDDLIDTSLSPIGIKEMMSMSKSPKKRWHSSSLFNLSSNAHDTTQKDHDDRDKSDHENDTTLDGQDILDLSPIKFIGKEALNSPVKFVTRDPDPLKPQSPLTLTRDSATALSKKSPGSLAKRSLTTKDSPISLIRRSPRTLAKHSLPTPSLHKDSTDTHRISKKDTPVRRKRYFDLKQTADDSEFDSDSDLEPLLEIVSKLDQPITSTVIPKEKKRKYPVEKPEERKRKLELSVDRTVEKNKLDRYSERHIDKKSRLDIQASKERAKKDQESVDKRKELELAFRKLLKVSLVDKLKVSTKDQRLNIAGEDIYRKNEPATQSKVSSGKAKADQVLENEKSNKFFSTPVPDDPIDINQTLSKAAMFVDMKKKELSKQKLQESKIDESKDTTGKILNFEEVVQAVEEEDESSDDIIGKPQHQKLTFWKSTKWNKLIRFLRIYQLSPNDELLTVSKIKEIFDCDFDELKLRIMILNRLNEHKRAKNL